MRFHNLKEMTQFTIAVAILFGCYNASASGGGEAEGESGAAVPKLSKDEKEFSEKTAKLNTLSSRITEFDTQFKDLVAAKNHAHSQEGKAQVIKQMVELTTERNKAVEEFSTLKSELSLRYPNQGERLNRHYGTQSKKSVEELEGAAGLDELLTQTRHIIKKKFAAFEESEDEAKKAAAIVRKNAEEEKPKKLRLEK